MPSSHFPLFPWTINLIVHRLHLTSTISGEFLSNFLPVLEKNFIYIYFYSAFFYLFFVYFLVRLTENFVPTYVEISKSSNAIAILILSHVSRFLYVVRWDCADPLDRRICFILETTQRINFHSYAYFIIYIYMLREMQERERESDLAPLSVCANDTRRCWKFCEITRGNAHRTRELLHIMKLCRHYSRILVSPRTGWTCDLSELHPVSSQNFISKLNQLCCGIIARCSYFITIQLLYAILNNEIISVFFLVSPSIKRREANKLMKITL